MEVPFIFISNSDVLVLKREEILKLFEESIKQKYYYFKRSDKNNLTCIIHIKGKLQNNMN